MHPQPFKNLNPFFFLLIAIILLLPSLCSGESLNKVISTGPSWNTFTNKDGTGLYHEILARIFNPHGITVVHTYTNATRGIYLVKNNLADFYTCKTKAFESPGMMLARYPMYEGTYHAIFKKKHIDDWQGLSSMTDRRVVWRRGYYTKSEIKVNIILLEADSGTSALTQIVLGRGDFYIDDLNLINESISNITIPFNMDEFRIEPVSTRTYHPVFLQSDRGKTIMALYEAGIEKLHRSGELKKIFEKWRHPYPGYNLAP